MTSNAVVPHVLGLLAGIGLAAASSQVAAATPCRDVAWTGSIGTIPVTATLEAPAASEPQAPQVGRYYYRASLGELFLRADAKDPFRWQETDAAGRVTGQWRLVCDGKVVGGEWRSADGRRALAVKGQVIDTFDYGKRHLSTLPASIARPAPFEGRALERLAFPDIPDVQVLRLPGNDPAIQRINAKLGEEALADLAWAADCLGDGRMRHGPGHNHEFHRDQTVRAWSARFLVVTTNRSFFCGEAHPYDQEEHQTFDLRSGEAVSLADWLREPYRGSIDAETSSALATEVTGDFLMTFLRDGGDNDDALDCLSRVLWVVEDLVPTPQGMIWTPRADHIDGRCAVPVTLSFERLLPYLSPAGREAVKAFR